MTIRKEYKAENGKLRDEPLNREIFYMLEEAHALIQKWKVEYNTFRSHNSLGYQPPAPEAVLPKGSQQTVPGILNLKNKQGITQEVLH